MDSVALLMLVAGVLVAAWALLGPSGRRVVPAHVEAAVRDEVAATDDAPLVVDGVLQFRIGVALRIAREVKMRFGGTPKDTEANRLLCARYVADACADNGITRKVDQWAVLCKARPLVFVPLREEALSAQWNGSSTLRQMRDDASGWDGPGGPDLTISMRVSCYRWLTYFRALFSPASRP